MAPSLDALLEGFHRREPNALARLLTRLDDGGPDAARILEVLGTRQLAFVPRIVGITGPPGAGKSTLVAAVSRDLRAAGETVAILAVDPDSPRTGGALLGDRVRMLPAAPDSGLFFRSLSARGSHGGLSHSIAAMADLLAAWGFDWILVETVGAGQGELAVRDLADVVILLLIPGTGDAIQFEKAGQSEIADIFVLNKADREGIDLLESSLRAALPDESRSAILHTIASEGVGVRALVDELRARRKHLLDAPPSAPDLARRRLRLDVEARVSEAIARLRLPQGEEERLLHAAGTQGMDTRHAADEFVRLLGQELLKGNPGK